MRTRRLLKNFNGTLHLQAQKIPYKDNKITIVQQDDLNNQSNDIISNDDVINDLPKTPNLLSKTNSLKMIDNDSPNTIYDDDDDDDDSLLMDGHIKVLHLLHHHHIY